MEAPEEIFKLAARPNARLSLPKRKRTKRQRGQSPFTFPITSSPSEERVSGKAGPLSPAGSSEANRGHEANDEEDMAHCLILLARGQHSRERDRRQLSVEEDDEEEQEAKNSDHHLGNFSSKRFLETGEYVFQCKTCDKVFPSFQALGGHRASHKKPKITAPATVEYDKRQILSTSSPNDVPDDEDALSLQILMNTKNSFAKTSNNGKQLPKVHECSFCGAEFSSGQALGGHMRRHRSLMTGSTPALALTPKTPESEEPSRPRNKVPSLQLDLNLPAPEDDNPEASFSIHPRGQERREGSSLVISFPALVGCHN